MGSRSPEGVQTKLPLFSMPSTMMLKGTALVEGPLRSWRETVLVVVGSHSMVKGLQAGTTWDGG